MFCVNITKPCCSPQRRLQRRGKNIIQNPMDPSTLTVGVSVGN